MPTALHVLSPSLATSVHCLCWNFTSPPFLFLLGKELILNKHLLYAQQFPPMTLSLSLSLILLRLSFLPFFLCGGFFTFLTCLLSPENRSGHLLSTYCVLALYKHNLPSSQSPSPFPFLSAASSSFLLSVLSIRKGKGH